MLAVSSLRMPVVIVLGVLIVATGVSVFSGFEWLPSDPEVARQFSPLGLLNGIKPEYWALESGSSFTGRLAPTFDYLKMFLLTCLFEWPFYWVAFRRWPRGQRLAALAVGNLLTHPAVSFLFPRFFMSFAAYALVAEAFAGLGEAFFAVYLLRGRDRAIGGVLMILANLVSWQLGSYL